MDEQKLKKAFAEVVDEYTGVTVASVKKAASSALPAYRNHRSGFEQRLQERWLEAFDLFEIILISAREIGEEFNQEVRSQASQSSWPALDVLTRLHARACLIAAEVYQLIRGGFASGALSRWRSLHETAVVAFFVAEHGDDVAEPYYAHDIVQSYWAAREYNRHHSTLGYEALEPGTTAGLKDECDRLEAKYGRSFFCSDYAWAHDAVNSGRDKQTKVTFEVLEQEVGLDHLRPFYRMASHTVHANPKSVSFDIGVTGRRNILLAGPTNTGFADPGACACISLSQVTVALLNQAPDVGTILKLKALGQLVEEAKVVFADIQRQITEDEERLHDEGEV